MAPITMLQIKMKLFSPSSFSYVHWTLCAMISVNATYGDNNDDDSDNQYLWGTNDMSAYKLCAH